MLSEKPICTPPHFSDISPRTHYEAPGFLPTCTRFPTHWHNVSYSPAQCLLPTCTRFLTHLHQVSYPPAQCLLTTSKTPTHLHNVSYPPAPGFLPTCTMSPTHLHQVSYPPAQYLLPTCTMYPIHLHNVSYLPAPCLLSFFARLWSRFHHTQVTTTWNMSCMVSHAAIVFWPKASHPNRPWENKNFRHKMF